MDAVTTLFIIIISCVLVFSVVTNIGVIIVVLRCRKIQTVTNILIINLAVSDILLAGLVIPQDVHDMSHASNYFEPDFLCKLVNFLPTFCITCSIYTLMVMALERYRAIVVDSTNKWTKRTLIKVLPIIWISSLTLATPMMINYSKVEMVEVNITSSVCSNKMVPYVSTLVYGVAVILISYLIPQIIIYTLYIRLAFFIWQKSQRRNGGLATSALSKHRTNIIKMLILCALFFCLSWLPYFILFTIEIVTGKTDSSDNEGITHKLQAVFAAFSTSYNGLLYLKYNYSFRQQCMKMFHCRAAEVEPCELSQTQINANQQTNTKLPNAEVEPFEMSQTQSNANQQANTELPNAEVEPFEMSQPQINEKL